MTQYFHIHPENPQARLIKQAVQIIRNGGVGLKALIGNILKALIQTSLEKKIILLCR